MLILSVFQEDNHRLISGVLLVNFDANRTIIYQIQKKKKQFFLVSFLVTQCIISALAFIFFFFFFLLKDINIPYLVRRVGVNQLTGSKQLK